MRECRENVLNRGKEKQSEKPTYLQLLSNQMLLFLQIVNQLCCNMINSQRMSKSCVSCSRIHKMCRSKLLDIRNSSKLLCVCNIKQVLRNFYIFPKWISNNLHFFNLRFILTVHPFLYKKQVHQLLRFVGFFHQVNLFQQFCLFLFCQ